MTEPGTRLVDNAILLMVARVSMALALPALSLFVILVQDKIDSMNRAQDNALAIVTQQFTTQNQLLVSQLNEMSKTIAADQANAISSASRITVLETRMTQDSVRMAAFETTMGNRYDRVQDALVNLSNQVAGLTATLRLRLEGNRPNSPLSMDESTGALR